MENEFNEYDILSRYYDEFQSEEDIELILNIILEQFTQYIETNLEFDQTPLLADLGCGTGLFSIPLLNLGFKVTAIDLSADMLQVVKQKSSTLTSKLQHNLELVNKDFLQHAFSQKQDLLLALTDTLNHLNPENMMEVFQFAEESLQSGGLFIFDLLTLDYLVEERGDLTYYAELGDDPSTPELAMVWENEWLESENLAISTFTFFQLVKKSGHFSRSTDQVIEYYHDLSTIENLWQNRFSCLQTIDFEERRLYVLQRL